MSFKLYLESQREQHLSDADGIQMMFGTDNIVAIDFNHPSAVNTNVKFYDDMHIPFLMGTNIRGAWAAHKRYRRGKSLLCYCTKCGQIDCNSFIRFGRSGKEFSWCVQR